MKTGFEVYIQSNLSETDKKAAVEFCQNFVNSTLADPKKRYFGVQGGGYTTGLWRGRLGLPIGVNGQYSDNIVFRRISKNRRTFAVVEINTMEVHNHKPLNKLDWNDKKIPDGPIPKMCCCPTHRGGLRVRFKNKPPMELFFRYGDVKG